MCLGFSVGTAHPASSQPMIMALSTGVSTATFELFILILFLTILKKFFPLQMEFVLFIRHPGLAAALVLIPHPSLSCPATLLTPALTGAAEIKVGSSSAQPSFLH